MISDCNITNIPQETALEVLKYLPRKDLGSFSQVDRRCLEIASNKSVWDRKFSFPILESISEVSEEIFEGSKDFLFNINPNLPRKLNLASCKEIGDEKMPIPEGKPGQKKTFFLKKLSEEENSLAPMEHLIFKTVPCIQISNNNIALKSPVAKNSWQDSAKIKAVYEANVTNTRENTKSLYRITCIMSGMFLKQLDCHVVKLDFYSYKYKRPAV